MKENDVTTLNAKANTAYNDLIAMAERENPGDVWAGFDGDQDAFETGYQAGYEAAAAVDREALEKLAEQLQHYIRPHKRAELADAVLTLVKGSANG